MTDPEKSPDFAVAKPSVKLGAEYEHRAFRKPRAWSNTELARFAHLYEGSVVNVSAWKDLDKQGRPYRSYFSACKRYDVTNFGGGQGGLQGWDNEVFLDLEAELPSSIARSYDVVFNHTTLEHVWDFRLAWKNLCDLSRDTVIIVVPWIQPLHTTYGDYWRFSPHAVGRLFDENGFEALYVSWNDEPNCAVYVFCVASRRPDAWRTACGAFARPPDLDNATALDGRFAGRSLFEKDAPV